jgi:CheY-like chemotaxis protein
MNTMLDASALGGRKKDEAVAAVPAALRILVVDDSDAARKFMVMKLEALARGSHSVTVDTAASGEEAVSSCMERRYDLVFLDMIMPGIGGLEACRRIKAAQRIRIAMLSSLKTADDYLQARSAGCDNYLAKPPQDGDILALLRIVSLRKLTAP